MALLLATARRANRPESEPALPPVRSLHYYLPVLDEVIAEPPPTAYRKYLISRLNQEQQTNDALKDVRNDGQDQDTR